MTAFFSCPPFQFSIRFPCVRAPAKNASRNLPPKTSYRKNECPETRANKGKNESPSVHERREGYLIGSILCCSSWTFTFFFLLETLFKVTFLLLYRRRQRTDYFWHFTYDLTLFKIFRNSVLFFLFSCSHIDKPTSLHISPVWRTIIYNYSLRRLKWRAKFRFKDTSLGGACLESARAIMKLVLSVL